jgi:GNAT superfamily N-acetyltransferase
MIREATLDDLEPLMELVKEFHYAANAKRDALFEDSVRGWAQWIVSCVEDDNKLCLVAEKGDSLVGFLTAFHGPAFWNGNVTLAAETVLWVSESDRGQGSGGSLLDRFVSWARDKNVNLVSAGANVNLGVKQVSKLLRSRGFQLEEKVFSLRLK